MKNVLGRKIILNIKFDRVFYDSKHFVLLSDTNFPHNECKFYEWIDIYWLAEINDYNELEKKVDVEIKDYDYKDIDQFKKQNSKGLLKSITFVGLKHKLITKNMWTYKPIMFEDGILELESKNSKNLEIAVETEFKETLREENNEQRHLSHKEELKEFVIDYPIDKIKCSDGSIDFVINSKMVPGLSLPQTKSLSHEIMLKEFQVLINYFEKITKKTHLKINLLVTYRNKFLEEIHISSDDLSLFTIEEFKNANILYTINRIKRNRKKETICQIDSILSIESETDLKNLILEILTYEISIHKNEIEYLTNKMHFSLVIKLKVVYKPDLSFLFLVIGESKIHFILETYQVDFATYIWSFDYLTSYDVNNEYLLTCYSTVEIEIQKIIDNNRSNYRSNYASNNFTVIDHDNSENGFLNWRSNLEAILN